MLAAEFNDGKFIGRNEVWNPLEATHGQIWRGLKCMSRSSYLSYHVYERLHLNLV